MDFGLGTLGSLDVIGLGEATAICFVLRLCKFELWKVSGIDNQARRFLTLSARTIFFKACAMPTLKTVPSGSETDVWSCQSQGPWA